MLIISRTYPNSILCHTCWYINLFTSKLTRSPIWSKLCLRHFFLKFFLGKFITFSRYPLRYNTATIWSSLHCHIWIICDIFLRIKCNIINRSIWLRSKNLYMIFCFCSINITRITCNKWYLNLGTTSWWISFKGFFNPIVAFNTRSICST